MFKSVRTAFSELSTVTRASSSAGCTCLSALLLPSAVCVCVFVGGGRVEGTCACDLETNAEHYTQQLPTCTCAQKSANSCSQPEAVDPFCWFCVSNTKPCFQCASMQILSKLCFRKTAVKHRFLRTSPV